MRGGFLLLTLLAFPAANAAADSFCKCPNRRVGVWINDSQNCEDACYGTNRAAPQTDWNAVREQEAAAARAAADAKAAREAEDRRKRKAKKDAEAADFKAKKEEAIRSMKGVSADEPGLKDGGGESHGLKGVAGETKLKGLDDSGLKGGADSEAAPRGCRIVDVCREALDGQRAALEEARGSQADLYSSMGTADLEHGKELAQEAIKESGVAGRVSIYVWKSKDKGLEGFRSDYKETVDEASELLDTDVLNDSAKASVERLKTVKKKAEALTEFAKYMKTLLACSKGGDAGYNRCVENANKHFAKALDGLPLAEATIARVKAASEAYSKYSTNALNRSVRASEAASKCFKGCL